MPLPPNNSQPKKHWFRRTLAIVLLLLWTSGLGWAALNHTVITDWWALRNYQAPVEISQLATDSAMSDYGRKLFYINYPVLEDKGSFNKSCPNNGGEQTIVLGCYTGGQSGIFLLRVNDARLNGVQQVTAAHEMLHSGYDRLGVKERDSLDAMLMHYYENELKDVRIKDIINSYRISEPNDVVNEMHSIFATEIAALPAGLEEYYARYFIDRQKVVALASQYQAEFTSRQNTINDYDKRLESIQTDIDRSEKRLDTLEVSMASGEANLDSLRNTDVAAYNAAVPRFNRLVDEYNALLKQVSGLIDQYNQLVNERNAIATEQEELVKELSNKAEPESIPR